jgi:hypothetical protein
MQTLAATVQTFPVQDRVDVQSHTLLKRRWASQAWLMCTLHWRDVRRTVMGTRSWAELFFLDEATALAAGHRLCFLCRQEATRAFQSCVPADGKPEMPTAHASWMMPRFPVKNPRSGAATMSPMGVTRFCSGMTLGQSARLKVKLKR